MSIVYKKEKKTRSGEVGKIAIPKQFYSKILDLNILHPLVSL